MAVCGQVDDTPRIVETTQTGKETPTLILDIQETLAETAWETFKKAHKIKQQFIRNKDTYDFEVLLSKFSMRLIDPSDDRDLQNKVLMEMSVPAKSTNQVLIKNAGTKHVQFAKSFPDLPDVFQDFTHPVKTLKDDKGHVKTNIVQFVVDASEKRKIAFYISITQNVQETTV